MKTLIIGDGNAAKFHRTAYESMGVRVIASLGEGVNWKNHARDADIISICSPDQFHFQQASEAIRMGKAVMCEKPPCLRLDELKFLTERAGAVPFACNLPLPWQDKFRQFGEAAARYGKPYLIEAEYNYGRRHKLIQGWRASPDYSLLIGGGIHMMDLILWYMGERPVDGASFKLTTALARNDVVQAIMKFPSGAIGRLAVNGSYEGVHEHRVTFYGESGHIVMTTHDEVDHSLPIRAFLDMIERGEKPDNSRLWHAMNILLQMDAS